MSEAPGAPEAEDLPARLAALERELTSLSANVAVLAAWAARYGVAMPYAPPPGSLAASAASAAVGTQRAAQSAAATSGTSASKPQPSAEQWIVRGLYGLGLFVLFIGAAIFIPATISVFGPGARTLTGVIAGLLVFGFGARSRTRSWVSDGAVALGAGLEYLSLWYAHSLHLVDDGLVFALMIATTGLVAALAAAYRSERLAFAGLAGGAVTPLLLATASPHPFALCAYLLLLSASALALAVVYRFRWLEFAIFALLLCYSPAWAWNGAITATWTATDALVATALFLVELALALVIGARRGDADVARTVLLSLEIAAFAVLLDGSSAANELLYAGALAAFAAVLAVAARAKAIDVRLREPLAWWSLGAAALLAQSLLSPSVGAPFAIEGAVLAALGARAGDDRVRLGAALAFATAFLTLPLAIVNDWELGYREPPFFNASFALLAVVALSLAAASWCERRAGARREFWSMVLRGFLHATASFALAREVYLSVPRGEFGNLAVTLFLTLYAAGLLAFGIRGRNAALRVFGVLLFFITTCKIFTVDLSGVDAGVRFISFLALGGVLVVMALVYRRSIPSEPSVSTARAAQAAQGESST